MKTTDQALTKPSHTNQDQIIELYNDVKSARKVHDILNIPYKQVRTVLDQHFDLTKSPAKWKTYEQQIIDLFNTGKTVTEIGTELQIKRTDVGTCLEQNKLRQKTNRNYAELPEQDIVMLYHDNNIIEKIAKMYNVSSKKINTILKRNNVEFRTNKIEFKYTDELIDLRINKRYSLNMLVTKYNYSKDLVKRVLKEHNIDYTTRYTDYDRLLLHQDEIIKMYNDNKTSYEISRKFNVCFNLILKVLRENNVFVRPQGSGQNSRSDEEISFFEFIKTEYDGVVRNNVYDVITPYELDIFIPELNIAFEYDGLYWHSEEIVEPTYHIMKTKYCYKKDTRLFHIFGDEWLNKPELVKSRVRNILGKSDRIYARKCQIKEVNNTLKRQFLNDNHIQGVDKSSVKLGLYYNDELVSLMTFGKPRFNKNYEWELIRFCNKLNTSVVGGASKLFKHFIKTHDPKSIISYSDLRWGNGKMYENVGMTYSHTSSPNYYYIIAKTRDSRHNYTKDKLIKQGFDPTKSEHEIMLERGIYRIYDCGNRVYTWNL